MWLNYHSIKPRDLQFPYQATSPTLRKVITYDKDEIWNEVDRIIIEGQQGNFTIGTNLFHNLLLCCSSHHFLDVETQMMIEEYTAMKRFNIPLSSNLDDTDYHRYVIFSSIDEEYNACVAEQQKKKANVR
tara:strand:- start:271 stop:660 length:390 start_codon:yes stop_codon:yes gene_type:complete